MAGIHVLDVDRVTSQVLIGTTDKGKKINLVHRAGNSIRRIEFVNGGKLPKQLEGGFSSVAAAIHVVESYLAKVKAKEIKEDGTKMPIKKAK